MEKQICAVCKQPIDDLLVVETANGPVHPGVCLQHVEQMPVFESDSDVLLETELLL
ncbi:conserved hypothetical protein [Acinetobacter phage Acj61]|jgi:hypothetical protein|uniref:Uncharacterized protein uvsY.-2 n=1 Tax=Acinetobacter phage Acj61 TaxID=760732 RepID=E5E4H2_9CAUD|nr:hypothetical protein Acj61p191 [Acinetobacter phage Acj61]ADG36156.1 conserved hypothetical protein [Acinetobacter phage Acj61]